MKFNCWEFKQCGREPGGANSQLGSCPAFGGPCRKRNAGTNCPTAAPREERASCRYSVSARRAVTGMCLSFQYGKPSE